MKVLMAGCEAGGDGRPDRVSGTVSVRVVHWRVDRDIEEAGCAGCNDDFAGTWACAARPWIPADEHCAAGRDDEADRSAVQAAGRDGDEAVKHVDVSKLRLAFVGDNKDRGYFFDNGYLRTAVGRACREAKEGPLKDEN
jgi:hypothetical protein